ncbi:MAG: glycosyltransferase [Planctomycetota bacterium]|nr:glycosyltransferase [Planctomycetota bacterium]
MVPSILGMTGALAAGGGHVRIVTPTPSDLAADRVPAGVTLDGPEASLEAAVRDADVIHLHGLWQSHTRRGARAATRAKRPYLIAAHGMAEPWALRQKRVKKSLYMAFVEGKNLRGASCLHALTRPEVGHLRNIAPRVPVALVPNGVNLAPFDSLPDRSALNSEHRELRGKFVLLFYSRLHKKKGLDLLAPALAQVARDYPEVHLLLAGNDDGALGPFLEMAEDLGISARITYVGHVAGLRARQVWARADAFVLPSYSEGFSMAVLEALACRLPTIITDACHFPELDAADAGLVVSPTVAAVRDGLRGLMERSPEQRRAMGMRGRSLVEERFTWERQAHRLAEVYAWLAGGGPRPEAVV